MNLFRQFGNAISGWLDIFAKRPAWRERFDLSLLGLSAALVWFIIAVLASILLQVLRGAAVNPAELVSTIAIYGLAVAGLALGIGLTIVVLRLSVTSNTLLVPAVYAVTFLLILGLPLALLGVPILPLLLGLLGYMLYRAGRVAGGLNVALSIAFAALCLVTLVALPLILYMVLAQGLGPA